MKNIKHLFFILIALLTVALCSCKGSASGSFTGSDKMPLTISITSNENIKLFNTKANAGRTIVADAFTTASTLHFYLWGTAQSGQSLEPKEVTVTPNKIGNTDNDDPYNGKVILDIDCYNWSLTLAACSTAPDELTSAKILENAVLVGYGNVDMLFTDKIKFTLSPKGLVKTGTVNLKLKLADNMVIPDGYTAKAYIYDIVTGAQIKSKEDTPADLFQSFGATTAATTAAFATESEGTVVGASFTANNKPIAPGTYSFQIEFTKQNESRKYVWNDTLIILPGTEVNKTITIPNLVGVKPNAPDSFSVTFNDNEESEFKDHYSVHFAWTQTSVVNETNFALQIVELKGEDEYTASVATKADFDAILADSTKYTAEYSFNYLNDIRANQRFYKSGSLFANSTSVDVYLELGKRYIARLYSENNAGYSTDAAYLTTITPPTNVNDASGTLSTINRFRVKYYNQGGKWNVGEAKNTDTDMAAKINYWSQTNNDKPYTVLNPVKQTDSQLGTTAQPYLYNGPADWIYWVTDLASGTKYAVANTAPYAPVPYDKFKNLDLYAIFARAGDVTFYMDTDYDINDAQADYVAGFGIAAAQLSSVNTNTASKGTLGFDEDHPDATTEVTVTLPSPAPESNDPTWIYDTVSLRISYGGYVFYNKTQDGAARGTGNTFTIPLKQLPTGLVYNCFVEAQFQMTTVSYPFTLYLTD